MPFLSKVTERAIYNQLEGYVEENNLHAYNQSAYRKGHSCETAILKVVGDIQEHIFRDRYVVLLMLDNSAAFDTVDHAMLIRILKNDFHLGNKALNLLNSYLKDRTFSVNIDGAQSKPSTLKHGVPQGSLLGPLLYIIYTKEIETIAARHNIQTNLYADDVQLYISFELEDMTRTKSQLSCCLAEIKNWMDSNYLKLNTNKTQLKIFKPAKTSLDFTFDYNETKLECSNQINLLGVTISKDMDFTSFIAKKVQICNFKLRNLNHIKDSLPFKTRITMVTNLIISNLDYCNSILICASGKAIKPLQLVLNRSIRFIFNLTLRTHITPYLRQLHILPIIYRIRYKACLISFKVFNELAPKYLTGKFTKYHSTSTMSLRMVAGSRDEFMFDNKIPNGKEHFMYKIKKEWNNLPLEIRRCQTISIFKTKLKTHFFKIAFDDITSTS